METALYHPTLGYYNRSDIKRWGREGDYRTSPERSTLFGATFAGYFERLREQLNSSSEFTIVEFGAGDGSFAAVVLDTLQRTSDELFNSIEYVVIEASPDARARDAKQLERFCRRIQFTSLQELDEITAGVVFSNELFDAFPVHRLTSIAGQLKELFVTLNDAGAFTWVADDLSSKSLQEFCAEHLPPLLEGQIVEVNLGIQEWLRTISEKLLKGYVITVDYGSEAEDLYRNPDRFQGTLRGFRHHDFVGDILECPGENDITTTVDWTYVKTVGRTFGLEVEEFAPLDKFLIGAGALAELEGMLAIANNDSDKLRLTTAAREMILPFGMAASFQVLVQKRIIS